MKVNHGNKSWTGTIGKTDDTNDMAGFSASSWGNIGATRLTENGRNWKSSEGPEPA